MRRRLARLSRYVPKARSQQPRQQQQQSRGPEEYVNRFKQGEHELSDANVGSYIRALARLDRLDAGGESPGAAAAVAGAAGQASAPMGTQKQPIYMAQVEPGFKSQLWRTVRALGTAFIVFTGLGALLEDRGLGKSVLGKDDVKAVTDSNTRFDDVRGVDEAKGELEELVDYLSDPERYTSLGGKLPHGVLLMGPPGTGKTMLARAVAGEAGVPFFYASGSEFEEMFVGVGARRIRDLFEQAKKNSPCIVFIDEIDAVGTSRSPRDQSHSKMTLNQLLSELDGFKPNEGVICIAATNLPESLDRALLRPGRFDRHVVVPSPDMRGRTQILEAQFKRVRLNDGVELTDIARGTPGFSGADLANLVNIAALRAARENRFAVSGEDLEFAKDRILMGAERKSAYIPEENRRLTAYHEGGHALVALYTEGASPLHKATIIPRGVSLGMTMQLPEKDETSVSRKQLLAKLDVCMAGRVAEELVFGEKEVTTGASSDFQHATKLARDMVTKYGMSERVGFVSQQYEDEGRNLSSGMRETIEQETRALLDASYARAKAILRSHIGDLHSLASRLLEEETLSGNQIRQLVSASSP